MPQRFTAIDNQTGKKVTFAWNADEPPTDADLEEVFAAARGPKPAETSAAPERDWVDALPSIAGTAFSLAGGSKALPTGAALAALGGAAGEGGRQLIRAVQGRMQDVPSSAVDQFKAMGAAGASQATLEGVGRGVGAALRPVGQALYGLAVRPSAALRKEHGLLNLVRRGYDDRVLPSTGGENKARELIGAGKKEAEDIAAASPVKIKMDRMLTQAEMEQLARASRESRAAGVSVPSRISEQIEQVRRSNPDAVTPRQLLDLRRAADEVADPAFREAQRSGGRVSPGSEAAIAKSLSDQYRPALRSVLPKRFEEVSRRTSTRVGVKQAAKEAAERPNMLTNLVAGGAGAASLAGDGNIGDAATRAALLRVLFSPTAQAATSFALPAIGKYGARAVDVGSKGSLDELLRRLMSSHEQEP